MIYMVYIYMYLLLYEYLKEGGEKGLQREETGGCTCLFLNIYFHFMHDSRTIQSKFIFKVSFKMQVLTCFFASLDLILFFFYFYLRTDSEFCVILIGHRNVDVKIRRLRREIKFRENRKKKLFNTILFECIPFFFFY